MATSIALTLPSLALAAETDFTVTRLREFVTTSLSDAALQVYLDGAVAAVNGAIGEPGETVEYRHAHGDLLPLSRQAATVSEVIEDTRWSATTLAADDYEISPTGRILMRLRTGTNPRWSWWGRVKVTYVPVDDTAARVRVYLALVQLELNHAPGLSAQQIGTWSEQYTSNSVMNYEIERASILATLNDGPGVI